MDESPDHVWWVPPPIKEWNLTSSCDSYARFASTILRKSDQKVPDMWSFDVYALHEYVAFSLPSTFQQSNKNFTRQHTALWYLSDCTESVSLTWSREERPCETAAYFRNRVLSMMFDAQDGEGACLEELRLSLDVKGNADMAGIGVMASFCIEAFLVIAFLTAYAVGSSRHESASPKRGLKILDAFRAVLPTFHWSSVLLSLGIIVASLKIGADVSSGGGQAVQLDSWRKGKSSYSPYDTQLAAMASLLSAVPPFMTGIMLRQSGRRRRLLNTIILPVLAILLIPLLIMFLSWNPLWDSASPSAAGRVVDLTRHDKLVMLIYTISAISTLFLTILVGCIALLCRRKRPGSAQIPPRRFTCTVVFTGLIQAVFLALMISALIMLFYMRARIINFGDDLQLEWGFGQILALTTWIPVVVDFIYTLSVGMKRGLEGHLPGDYSVVQQQETEEAGKIKEELNDSVIPKGHPETKRVSTV